MTRYLVFEQRTASLTDEEGAAKPFILIPEIHIKMGIVVPRSNPLLDPEPVAEIDAKDEAEARAVYQDKRENAFM